MTEISRLSLTCCALLLCAAGDARSDPAPVGNPYSFYGSVAECAAAQRSRCDDCLADHTCTPITDTRDGDAECTQLADHDGRGDFLICINLALAIDAVNACTARGSPCPRDAHASESLSSLEANAQFLDDPACAAPLDTCLAALYGAPAGGFPSPGSDPGPPPDTAVDCGDSCSGDSSCDSLPGCEVHGSCDDSEDSSCSDSGDSSGCDDTSGGDAGGDSCSGDSEDACGSDDNSSCDSSDCGGGGDSDCSSSGEGGGDCGGESGGGDCGGGGGGGDCGGGGGGGDCSVAAKRGRVGTSLPVTIAWAMLPIPIAVLVRRRAERRRARASGDGQGDGRRGEARVSTETGDGDTREVSS